VCALQQENLHGIPSNVTTNSALFGLAGSAGLADP